MKIGCDEDPNLSAKERAVRASSPSSRTRSNAASTTSAAENLALGGIVPIILQHSFYNMRHTTRSFKSTHTFSRVPHTNSWRPKQFRARPYNSTRDRPARTGGWKLSAATTTSPTKAPTAGGQERSTLTANHREWRRIKPKPGCLAPTRRNGFVSTPECNWLSSGPFGYKSTLWQTSQGSRQVGAKVDQVGATRFPSSIKASRRMRSLAARTFPTRRRYASA